MFEILEWGYGQDLHRLRLDEDGRVTESASWNGHWVSTSYAYGDFGALSDVWDGPGQTGNHTELGYDKLGRRTLLDDPDKGKATYKYNGFSELAEQNDDDPTTPSIVFQRDALGRVTKRTDNDGATYYYYDGPGALGKLWQATSPDGVSTTLSYDTRGRVTGTEWNITSPGGPGPGDGQYKMTRDYDDLGRLAKINYPETGVPGNSVSR